MERELRPSLYRLLQKTAKDFQRKWRRCGCECRPPPDPEEKMSFRAIHACFLGSATFSPSAFLFVVSFSKFFPSEKLIALSKLDARPHS